MKRHLLFRYIGGHFLTNTIGAIVGLAGLVELLDMLDNATDIFDRHLGFSGLWTYLLLRMPSTFDQVITLGILIGGLVTFSQAARHNEIAAIRSAGITVYRLALLLAPYVAIFAALHFVIADQVAPRTAKALSVWWDASTPPSEKQDDSDSTNKTKDIWFRLGPDIVSVARTENGGTHMDGVRIYRRNNDGELKRRVVAASADFAKGVWTLHDVTKTIINDRSVEVQHLAEQEWQNALKPGDLISLANPASPLSSSASRRALEGALARNRPVSFYEMQIQASYASVVASFVMLLLSLPAAFVTPRDARSGWLVIRSMVLGLMFVLANGVLQAFGSSGALPPPLAAWAGIGVFSMIGTWLLLKLEDR